MAAARSSQVKESILDAAQQVVIERGAGRITLEDVARASGLSKGGLLYHFPSKEALIQAMLERLIETTTVAREAAEKCLPEKPCRTLMALLETRNRPDVINPSVATALLAAAAEQPDLLEPLRTHIAEVSTVISRNEADRHLCWLLWAAADGLLFQELLRIAPYPPEEHSEVYQRLLDLAQELLSCA